MNAPSGTTVFDRLGSLMGLMGVILLFPFVIIAIGAPVALVVWLVATLIEQF